MGCGAGWVGGHEFAVVAVRGGIWPEWRTGVGRVFGGALSGFGSTGRWTYG